MVGVRRIIERVNVQPRPPVAHIAVGFARAHIAVESMLRPKKFYQVKTLCVIQHIHRRASMRVRTGRICHQPHALALQHREVRLLQLIDTQRHSRCARVPGKGDKKPERQGCALQKISREQRHHSIYRPHNHKALASLCHVRLRTPWKNSQSRHTASRAPHLANARIVS